MYIICLYVPATHAEEVKNAMFMAGAGKIGNYSCCAWQTLGEGQFMPLEQSNAFIGEKNILARIAEYKIEMVCDENSIHQVIDAMKNAHPYEEPAFHIIENHVIAT